jgi:hypothetical protein
MTPKWNRSKSQSLTNAPTLPTTPSPIIPRPVPRTSLLVSSPAVAPTSKITMARSSEKCTRSSSAKLRLQSGPARGGRHNQAFQSWRAAGIPETECLPRSGTPIGSLEREAGRSSPLSVWGRIVGAIRADLARDARLSGGPVPICTDAGTAGLDGAAAAEYECDSVASARPAVRPGA